MAAEQRIILDNATLRARYTELAAGDLVVGRVRLKPGEESMLLDLRERGVTLIPSATSQLASRLKTVQTRLFSQYMIPWTMAVYDLHDLREAISLYGRCGVGKVVSKHDRKNAGMGVHLWNSIEEIYTLASFETIRTPFVIQPYVAGCRDIRVIIIDGYIEAYWRQNDHSFRNNLHFGGKSTPCALEPEQLKLCADVMQRGGFPYAHIDLMITPEGKTYLAEINLRGGLRGAAITGIAYQNQIEAVHQRLANLPPTG